MVICGSPVDWQRAVLTSIILTLKKIEWLELEQNFKMGFSSREKVTYGNMDFFLAGLQACCHFECLLRFTFVNLR